MSYTTQLVESAIAGDKQAFEQLIRYESEKLYKIAFLHMRNKKMHSTYYKKLHIRPIFPYIN